MFILTNPVKRIVQLNKKLKILILEPFYRGSHKQFIDGLVDNSQFEFEILAMPGANWKWATRSSPLYFYNRIIDENIEFDLVLCSDFMDVAAFRGIASQLLHDKPIVLYMHENQITYPVKHATERDYHFGFTNLTSINAADLVLWNSAFHRQDFFEGARNFLKRLPGSKKSRWLDCVLDSKVVYMGVDAPVISKAPETSDLRADTATPLRVLWNHRWEFDKNPEAFFESMCKLAEEGHEFELYICGESFKEAPPVFAHVPQILKRHIKHFGYVSSRDQYWDILQTTDVAVSCAIHEFFGIAVLESYLAGNKLLLPQRLSYPELFKNCKDAVFYQDYRELELSLSKMSQDPSSVRNNTNSSLEIDFAWSQRAKEFDSIFDDIINGH